jgi:hypothetical protein
VSRVRKRRELDRAGDVGALHLKRVTPSGFLDVLRVFLGFCSKTRSTPG